MATKILVSQQLQWNNFTCCDTNIQRQRPTWGHYKWCGQWRHHTSIFTLNLRHLTSQRNVPTWQQHKHNQYRNRAMAAYGGLFTLWLNYTGTKLYLISQKIKMKQLPYSFLTAVIHRETVPDQTILSQQNEQVCRSSLMLGRNVRWPRRMLPPGESCWVCRRDRQMDRKMDARPLHYTFHQMWPAKNSAWETLLSPIFSPYSFTY